MLLSLRLAVPRMIDCIVSMLVFRYVRILYTPHFTTICSSFFFSSSFLSCPLSLISSIRWNRMLAHEAWAKQGHAKLVLISFRLLMYIGHSSSPSGLGE